MDMQKQNKKITASVSHECWKALKMLAVQKEVSLQLIVQEILEKAMGKKIKGMKLEDEDGKIV
jgi:hypothetical protein